MTLAVALQVHDGVVLASDSAITLKDMAKAGPDNISNVYGHGNKIFNIVKGLPIGAVFYGTANLGSSSISTLMKDVRRRFSGEEPKFKTWKLDNKYTVEDVAKKVREFLYEETFLKLAPVPNDAQFGMMIAGYGAVAQLSETWTIAINGSDCPPPKMLMAQGVSNIMAGGDPDAFLRLANGFSPRLGEVLLKSGLDPLTIGKVMNVVNSGALTLQVVEAPMPIQDAVELAEFFVDTTSRLAHFKRGFATVGGPTESAAITKHEGFRWVRRKHYFSADLNPGVKP